MLYALQPVLWRLHGIANWTGYLGPSGQLLLTSFLAKICNFQSSIQYFVIEVLPTRYNQKNSLPGRPLCNSTVHPDDLDHLKKKMSYWSIFFVNMTVYPEVLMIICIELLHQNLLFAIGRSNRMTFIICKRIVIQAHFFLNCCKSDKL